ncbi:DUF2382 domain-containing protein [Nocardiopsis sp. HNM0947]|uniref:DUF2382 domain-containing protein n=1 Tax=Nocardiopsis coralli TaxID=2772213 RepID=A0ABR9P1F1_9ACTN|nr:PRC and DUF2382 domain-containing protein [Nocardiopsis coralli]MBE2997667.1 DUF2382 domain-containing protein [Nocardiopsis coralli]
MAHDLRPENLIGHQLLDGEGHSVGKINQVYLDDRTNEPSWVSVHTGLFGRKETLVPLQGAQPHQEDLQVPYDKSTVKDAPHVDSGTHISPETEAQVRDYYAEHVMVPNQRAGRHERGYSDVPVTDRETDDSMHPGTGYSEADVSMRPGDEHAETTPPVAATEPHARAATGSAATETTGTEDVVTESGTPGVVSEDTTEGRAASGSAAPEGTAPTSSVPEARSTQRPDTVPMPVTTDSTTAPETGAGAETDGEQAWGEAFAEDVTMTRSEEQVDIGVERVEIGRARLHRYVDAEDYDETVTLRREELEIERHPVDVSDEGEDLDAPIGEDEQIFTLYEERTVVSKKQVPVERVHVRKRMVSHEEHVQGTRRSERIELEDEQGHPPSQR